MRYYLGVSMPFLKPSDIPQDGITPESLSKLSGVDLSYIQGRTLQGRTPIVKGKISKRDALILLRDSARAEREALEAANAAPPPVAPAQGKTSAQAAVVQRERIGKVADMLAQMIPNRTIRKNLSAQWGIQPAQVEKLIELAYAELASLGKFGETSRRDQMRDAFAEFYREAMAIGNLQAAALALDRLAKIDGCYAPTASTVKVDGALAGSVNLNSPDVIRQKMAKYLEDPDILAKIDKLTRGS